VSGQPITIRDLFEHAVKLQGDERSRFVELVAVKRPEMHAELLRLLQAHETSSGFLSEPAEAPTTVLEQITITGSGPGTQLGPYRLIKEIGRGGMGTVYLAERDDDTFRKTVALKIIRRDAASEDFIRRFKQERQILAALDHPNITRILDGGTTPSGEPYFVMDYVDGVPIEKFCDEHKFSVTARVNLVLQLCDAVAYLHDNSIIHRDLKPSNVMVDREGRAKLLDFGIAKVLSLLPLMGGSSADGPTMIMTPGFASPEQLSGKPATKASDQYALAIILYQLLTGKSPFISDSGDQNMFAQLSDTPVPPPSTNLVNLGTRTIETEREFRRRVVGDLDRIVLKALHSDSTRRYDSVAHLARDLRNYLEGLPVTARPESLFYRLNRYAGRNRAVVALLVLLVAATAVGGFLGVRLYLEGVRAEARQAEVDRLFGTLNTRLDTWSRPATEGGPSVAERVADVQKATLLLSQDAPALLSNTRADLPRLDRLVDQIVGYLDRASTLSTGQTPVLVAISNGYENAGNFEAVAATRNDPTKKVKARQNYTKAATVVSSAPDVDPKFLQQRLEQLDKRLATVGARLDPSMLSKPAEEAPLPVEPAPEPVVPAAVKKSTPVAAPVAPPPSAPPATTAVAPQNQEEMKELIQRLDFAVAQVARARKNVEDLRRRLAERGQTVQGDTESAMSQAEAYLQQARAAAGQGNAAATKENLVQAEYTLRKVFRLVGN
jgi:serine/threonine protein kinase